MHPSGYGGIQPTGKIRRGGADGQCKIPLYQLGAFIKVTCKKILVNILFYKGFIKQLSTLSQYLLKVCWVFLFATLVNTQMWNA